MSAEKFNLFAFTGKMKVLHLSWMAFFITFMVWFNHAPLLVFMIEAFDMSSQQVKALMILNVALTIPARIVIGILVDDGIVIGENIYHHYYDLGKSKIRAAIDGTMEVIPPIVSAILTTIIAFSTFFFVDGRIGSFFGEVSTIVIDAKGYPQGKIEKIELREGKFYYSDLGAAKKIEGAVVAIEEEAEERAGGEERARKRDGRGRDRHLYFIQSVVWRQTGRQACLF